MAYTSFWSDKCWRGLNYNWFFLSNPEAFLVSSLRILRACREPWEEQEFVSLWTRTSALAQAQHTAPDQRVESSDTFHRSLEEHPHRRLKSPIGRINSYCDLQHKSNTTGQKKIQICDLFSASHAEAQNAGKSLFQSHAVLLKSVRFDPFFFINPFSLLQFGKQRDQSDAGENRDQLWGGADQSGGESETGWIISSQSGYTAQCLSLSALWSPLWFVSLCVAIVLYFLYVWCGSSVSFLWWGHHAGSLGEHESPLCLQEVSGRVWRTPEILLIHLCCPHYFKMLAAEKVPVWTIYEPESAWRFCGRGLDVLTEIFHSDSGVIYLLRAWLFQEVYSMFESDKNSSAQRWNWGGRRSCPTFSSMEPGRR